MRTKIILFLLVSFPYLLIGQDKYDYTWLLGYPPNWPDQKYGGSLLQFDGHSPAKVLYGIVGLDLGSVGEICDASGNLQFYTNGCEVFNAQHRQMEDGGGINTPYPIFFPGDKHNCIRNLEYPNSYNGLLALPVPGNAHGYVFFHLRYDQDPNPGAARISAPKSMLYTRIDMAANGGAGRVTEKNIVLWRDSFCEHLGATRHGNGRDWWVVAQKATADTAFAFLLTPTGVKGPLAQKIGVPWPHRSPFYSGGQSVFSPQGDRYARANFLNGIHLYHFDRCNGLFSNPIVVPLPDNMAHTLGLAFSPSGRWLYFTTGIRLYQYDCWANDVAATKQLIAEYDGFKSFYNLSTTFNQMRLGPDGKIYMSATNGVDFLHIIHNPDAQGADCRFEQHALELPAHNGFCLPNFPNFRLYDWAGSPCDTLLTAVAPRPEPQPLRLSPNPCDAFLEVSGLGESACQWAVVAPTGQILKQGSHTGNPRFDIPTTDLPNGAYWLAVRQQRGGPSKVFKFVVLR